MEALNKHLRDKFCAQPAPFDCWTDVDMDLYEDGNRLYEETSDRLVEPITKEELRGVLKFTKSNSVLGPDGIMVKSLKLQPEVAVKKILEFFNEVLMCGYVPDDWKGGKSTMTRKKYPDSVLANLRPISLVSVVGKWFMKILAISIN